MPSPQTIALFMVSALALNLTPGPAILFILSRSFGHGRAAAAVSVFGLATASVIQATAAASGLSALFVYSPLAFALVQYCGAAYLVYLGVAGFLSGGLAGIAGRNKADRRSLASAYWHGLLTDLLSCCSSSRSCRSSSTRRGASPVCRCSSSGCCSRSPGADQSRSGTLWRIARRSDRPPAPLGILQRWCSSAVLIGLGIRLALGERR